MSHEERPSLPSLPLLWQRSLQRCHCRSQQRKATRQVESLAYPVPIGMDFTHILVQREKVEGTGWDGQRYPGNVDSR